MDHANFQPQVDGDTFAGSENRPGRRDRRDGPVGPGESGDGARDPYAWEADLYDAATGEVSERDVPFYTALAADAAGPLLELACGTGRVLAPCAAAMGPGVAAVGVDVSPTMLARARVRTAASRVEDRVRLELGDMRTVRLDLRFPWSPSRSGRCSTCHPTTTGWRRSPPSERTWSRADASPPTSSCPTRT